MANRNEWQKRVAQWKKSGLTARAFAAQQGLHPRTLAWWISTLRRTPSPSTDLATPVPFARLLAPSPSVSSLDIVLPSGPVLRVRPGFDPDLLLAVLRVLEAP